MKHHILLLMIISSKLSADCNIHDKMTEKHEHWDCTVFGGWIIVIPVILNLVKI